MKKIRRILVFTFCTFNLFLSAQVEFHGIYKDHTFKVDDYVYLNKDSVIVSSVEPHQLDNCKIMIRKSLFNLDDGGMGFKSQKVLTEVTQIKEGYAMYSIKGPYGDTWNILRAIQDDLSIIGVFHAKKKMQPVMNYTLFSKTKLTRKEISNFVLEYLSLDHDTIKDRTLIEVDKYEISDLPEIRAFIKRIMQG